MNPAIGWLAIKKLRYRVGDKGLGHALPEPSLPDDQAVALPDNEWLLCFGVVFFGIGEQAKPDRRDQFPH